METNEPNQFDQDNSPSDNKDEQPVESMSEELPAHEEFLVLASGTACTAPPSLSFLPAGTRSRHCLLSCDWQAFGKHTAGKRTASSGASLSTRAGLCAPTTALSRGSSTTVFPAPLQSQLSSTGSKRSQYCPCAGDPPGPVRDIGDRVDLQR